ncbi:PKD domain-containing protein [Flavobacterium poyangense]|uniref:PKD domain-containing protein n=1 Tax=Flavobacterium poyangense TaxID=2204302 RepID=UPI001AB03F8E|nr:PKD domain-containing protein [Flavobacterium sp. JXAS1]
MKSLIVVVAIIFLGFSCSKKDTERIIDCVGESLRVHITDSKDATDKKKVNFTVDYSGSYTFVSVKWDFGDGTVQEVTTKTISHTYSKAGTFAVKADISVKSGKSNCTFSPKRNVTVE